MNKWLLGLGAIALLGAGFWLSLPKVSTYPSASVADALSGPADAGFARATLPRLFQFPQDDGPHPAFQTEWWYWTGNLETAAQRHFGYQLTFFRRALNPELRAGSSDWGTNQIYFAHFTLSDPQTGKFHSAERFSRGAAGLAGAQAEPFRVWLENWQVKGDRLQAKQDDYTVDLQLKPLKPPILQGQQGLSQKNAGLGNASYYYSRSRIETQGRLSIGHEQFEVKGLSWLDREWSTSVLAADQVGWDWFSLQFEDGRELMLYQLRQKDGKVSAFSAGSFIDRQSKVIPLKVNDFRLEPLARWKSPTTGITYPSRWRVSVPSQRLEFEVIPWQADQELRGDLVYWEGAVQIRGDGLKGNGYVELTGYNEAVAAH